MDKSSIENVKIYSNNYKSHNKLTITNVVLFLIYSLPMTFIFGATSIYIGSSILFILMIYLFLTDKFYLILPILMFFYNIIELPGGIAIQPLFFGLYMLKVVLFNKIRILDITSNLGILIFTLYSLSVIFIKDFKRAFFIIFSIIVVILFVKHELSSQEKLKKFLKYLVYAAMIASIYGMINKTGSKNIIGFANNDYIYVSRFLATFNDPNYAGFFFNISIFCILILNIFEKRLKIILLIILYSALIATLSFTGLICNAIGIFIWMLLLKRRYSKDLLIVCTIILSFFMIYNLSLRIEIPIMSDLSTRVATRSQGWQTKSIESITSSRSLIWAYSWNYFTQQSALRIFCGGNIVNNTFIDSNYFQFVPHQEYITLALNIGIIGLLLIGFVFIMTSYKAYIKYKITKESIFLVLLLIKFIWFFYGLSITYFPNWIFYIFLFI
jgi:O-antigen ligase